MKTKTIKEILASLQIKDVISIHTNTNPDENIEGLVIKISETFIMLHRLDDACLCSVIIVSIDDVFSIKKRTNTFFYQEVLKAYPAIDTTFLHSEKFDLELLDLSSYELLFKGLKTLHPLISISGDTENGDYFKIGLIDKVMPNYILLKQFDSNGIWQKDLFKANYDEITEIEFGNSYSEVFYHYLKTLHGSP